MVITLGPSLCAAGHLMYVVTEGAGLCGGKWNRERFTRKVSQPPSHSWLGGS